MNLSSITSFLVLLANLKPEIYDALIPHGPKISQGTRNVMASTVIKSMTHEIKDADIVKELQKVGNRLFSAGIKSMSYQDDDWYAITYKPYFGLSPESWFFERQEVMLNPQPLPPREQGYYDALLTTLAKAVSHKEASEVLSNIGPP